MQDEEKREMRGRSLPIEHFDEAMRQQSHAQWVGRRIALARSLNCQIVTAIWLRALTSRTLLRPHHGLADRGAGP